MRSPFPPHQTPSSLQLSRLEFIGVLLLSSFSAVALWRP